MEDRRSGDCGKKGRLMTRGTRRTIIAFVAIVLVGSLGYRYMPFILAHLSPIEAPNPIDQPEGATRMDAPPLENFYRVTDDLYRGAQPDEAGMAKLKELGIQTVVNLRLAHSDRDEIGQIELGYEHIPVDPFKPTEDHLLRFLEVVTDPNRLPVFVHCQRGIDRTGMAVAVYRMMACGWKKEQALYEMMKGPYGYDSIFVNVPVFLDKLDIDDLRSKMRQGVE